MLHSTHVIVCPCERFLTLSLKFSRICLSRKGLHRSAPLRNAWIQSSQKRLLTGGENFFIRILDSTETQRDSVHVMPYLCWRMWVGWWSSLWSGWCVCLLWQPYTEKLLWCLVGTDPANWPLWWTWHLTDGQLHLHENKRVTCQVSSNLDYPVGVVTGDVTKLTWTHQPLSFHLNYSAPHLCDSAPVYRTFDGLNALFQKKKVNPWTHTEFEWNPINKIQKLHVQAYDEQACHGNVPRKIKWSAFPFKQDVHSAAGDQMYRRLETT